MNRYIVDEFYRDPSLRRKLFSRARKERSKLLLEAFAWLRDRLTPRLHLRDQLARLG